MDDTERRYLVVVVGMLVGPDPAEEIYRLSKAGPARFHFLVPPTKPDYGLTWTEDQAVDDARQRLEIMVEFGTAMGMQVSGEVAKTDDPVDATRAAAPGFDEVIVIDNPRGPRRWCSDSDIADLRVDPGLPLRHLAANPPMTQGKHFDTEELRGHFRQFLAELRQKEGLA